MMGSGGAADEVRCQLNLDSGSVRLDSNETESAFGGAGGRVGGQIFISPWAPRISWCTSRQQRRRRAGVASASADSFLILLLKKPSAGPGLLPLPVRFAQTRPAIAEAGYGLSVSAGSGPEARGRNEQGGVRSPVPHCRGRLG